MGFFFEIFFWQNVNLRLQFVIGLLISNWACAFSWIILTQTNSIKEKKKKTNVLVGSVGSHMILWSYIWSYHFYDLTTILNVLVRWNCKIVRSYNTDRDFGNHGWNSKSTLPLIWKWEISQVTYLSLSKDEGKC